MFALGFRGTMGARRLKILLICGLFHHPYYALCIATLVLNNHRTNPLHHARQINRSRCINVLHAAELFHKKSAEFAQDLIESSLMVMSHTICRENNFLAEQCVQISFVTCTVVNIYFIFLWWQVTCDLMIWLGFNANIATMSQQHTNVSM